jgi:predicted NodU family carbamoyl transferase
MQAQTITIHDSGPVSGFPAAISGRLKSIALPKIIIGHRLAHGASAYYISGLTEATIRIDKNTGATDRGER